MAAARYLRSDRRRGGGRGCGFCPGTRRTAGFAARSRRAGRCGRQFRQRGAYCRRVGAAAALAGLAVGLLRDCFASAAPLDLPPRQALRMSPWIGRFAAAAFQRDANTRHLRRWCALPPRPGSAGSTAIGRPELLKRHGHYEIALGPKSRAHMQRYAQEMARIGVKTRSVPAGAIVCRCAGRRNAATAAGLWFEDSALRDRSAGGGPGLRGRGAEARREVSQAGGARPARRAATRSRS